MRRLIIMASLLAIIATACKLELNVGAVINADGSGTIVMEVGMDEVAKSTFLSDGTDPFSSNELSECPGATDREEQRGDLTFYIVECDLADVSAVETMLTETDNTMMSSFNVTVTDTLVSVNGEASSDEALGPTSEGFPPDVFEEMISANLKITMPGRITDHNADSQDGNTLTWSIPVLGGTLNVSAQSDPNGTPAGGGGAGGFPTWLIVVIVLVVLGGGYYLWSQNKKKGGAAPAAADTPPPAA